MRITWNPGWPGIDGHWLKDVARRRGIDMAVTLDGERQYGVVMADTEAGEVLKLVRGESGRVLEDPAHPGYPLVSTFRGRVELREEALA